MCNHGKLMQEDMYTMHTSHGQETCTFRHLHCEHLPPRQEALHNYTMNFRLLCQESLLSGVDVLEGQWL